MFDTNKFSINSILIIFKNRVTIIIFNLFHKKHCIRVSNEVKEEPFRIVPGSVPLGYKGFLFAVALTYERPMPIEMPRYPLPFRSLPKRDRYRDTDAR